MFSCEQDPTHRSVCTGVAPVSEHGMDGEEGHGVDHLWAENIISSVLPFSLDC